MGALVALCAITFSVPQASPAQAAGPGTDDDNAQEVSVQVDRVDPAALATAFEVLNKTVLVGTGVESKAAVSRALTNLGSADRLPLAPGLLIEADRLREQADGLRAEGRVRVTDVSVSVADTRVTDGVTVLTLHVKRALDSGVIWEELQPVAIVGKAAGGLDAGDTFSVDAESVNAGLVPAELTKRLGLSSSQQHQDAAVNDADGEHDNPGSSEGVTATLLSPTTATPPPDVVLFEVGSGNRTKIANYALQYALSYNKNYYSYANKNADCTNFISQALKAGGWTYVLGPYRNNNVWWYTGQAPTYNSFTWSAAENWYKFARNESKRAGVLTSVNATRIGDIVQFKDKGATNMTHSMVVTSKTGGVTYVSGHTPNVKNAPASSYNKSGRTWFAHKI